MSLQYTCGGHAQVRAAALAVDRPSVPPAATTKLQQSPAGRPNPKAGHRDRLPAQLLAAENRVLPGAWKEFGLSATGAADAAEAVAMPTSAQRHAVHRLPGVRPSPTRPAGASCWGGVEGLLVGGI